MFDANLLSCPYSCIYDIFASSHVDDIEYTVRRSQRAQRVILGKVCDVPWIREIVYWIFAPVWM